MHNREPETRREGMESGGGQRRQEKANAKRGFDVNNMIRDALERRTRGYRVG